jgi:hypothetical protein
MAASNFVFLSLVTIPDTAANAHVQDKIRVICEIGSYYSTRAPESNPSWRRTAFLEADWGLRIVREAPLQT